MYLSRIDIQLKGTIATGLHHHSILAIKQLPYNPTSKNSEENDYFEEAFLLKL